MTTFSHGPRTPKPPPGPPPPYVLAATKRPLSASEASDALPDMDAVESAEAPWRRRGRRVVAVPAATAQAASANHAKAFDWPIGQYLSFTEFTALRAAQGEISGVQLCSEWHARPTWARRSRTPAPAPMPPAPPALDEAQPRSQPPHSKRARPTVSCEICSHVQTFVHVCSLTIFVGVELCVNMSRK